MTSGNAKRLFLSHAGADVAAAVEIRSKLQQRGYEVWLDAPRTVLLCAHPFLPSIERTQRG